MESIILSYLTLWKPLVYFIFFVAMLFEGEIFLFTAFFLVQRGYFDPGYIFITIFSGITIGDVLWFRLGMWLKHSNSRLVRWAEKISRPFDKHLLRRPLHMIVISKFIYGTHRAILLRAGTLNIKPERFLKTDLIANIIWVTVVGGLGYLSGLSYHLIKSYLRFGEIALLIGLVLFLSLETLFSYISSRQWED